MGGVVFPPLGRGVDSGVMSGRAKTEVAARLRLGASARVAYPLHRTRETFEAGWHKERRPATGVSKPRAHALAFLCGGREENPA